MQKTQRPSADQTRSLILKVSRKLFAKKGFSGTSIGDIAKGAKINQSLIYHHFEDKIGLWKAVKTQIVENYAQMQECKSIVELPLREYLTKIICWRIGIFNNNPDMLRILSWQDLEPNAGSLMSLNVGSCSSWVEDIKLMQKQGRVRPDYDPYMIVTLITNACKGAHRDGPGEFNMLEKNRQEKYIVMCIDAITHFLQV